MKIQINIDYSDYNQNYLSSSGGIFKLDDVVYINVRNLSDIYPEFSKKFKIKLKEQIMIERQYKIGVTNKEMDFFIETQKKAKQEIENGSAYFKIMKTSPYSLINIDKVCQKGCVIDISNLSNKEAIELLQSYHFNDRVQFKDLYNPFSLITQKQLLQTYEFVEQITNTIKKHQLSPLESLIFLYDIARSKPYKLFEHNQSVSRDLNQIIKNGYIVCEGYANLINAVCHSLQIPSEKICWYPKNGKKGHASNIIYLNDDNYDIHQFVEIDAVYGTKKQEDDHDYINDYSHLFDPFSTAVLVKKNYEYQNNLLLYKPMIQYNRLNNWQNMMSSDILKFEVYRSFVLKIYKVAFMIGHQSLINLCNQELEQIKKYHFDQARINLLYTKYNQLMSKRIEQDNMIEAIYKVRRVEYLLDPQNYPLSPYIFDKIIQNSFPKNQQDRLLDWIFSKTPIDKISNISILDNIEIDDPTDKVDYDIKRIELLRILRQELQKKKSHQKTRNHTK